MGDHVAQAGICQDLLTVECLEARREIETGYMDAV